MEKIDNPESKIDTSEQKTLSQKDIAEDKKVSESKEDNNSPDKIKEIDDREYVDSNSINPSRNLDDPHFYEGRHSEEEFQAMAEKIPEVKERLANGESLDDIKQDENCKDCAEQYFDEKKMLTVRENDDGSYQLIDDGNHRLKAAQDLGYEVPVKYEGS